MPQPGTTDGLSPQDFEDAQRSPQFRQLKLSFRSFAFPMTLAFIAWYFLYVLLSTYQVDFMSIRVFGTINLGLLIGLGQFVTTFLITWLYVRHANRSLDPKAEAIRADLEARAAGAHPDAGDPPPVGSPNPHAGGN